MLETGRRILTWSGLPNVQVAELVNQAKSPKKVAKSKAEKMAEEGRNSSRGKQGKEIITNCMSSTAAWT